MAQHTVAPTFDPPLSLLPAQTDAHDGNCAAEGNCCIPTAISAARVTAIKNAQGQYWLRRACEAAWAASRTKNTYLSAQYRRIAAKRGQKRASLAVAHSILVIAYHLLNDKVRYQEVGGDYFDRIRTAGLKHYLKRLEQLGVSVIESPADSVGRRRFSREAAEKAFRGK